MLDSDRFVLNKTPYCEIEVSINYPDPEKNLYTNSELIFRSRIQDSSLEDVLHTRWDFNGDGIWETNWELEPEYSTGRFPTSGNERIYSYSAPGFKTIRLEVRDKFGARYLATEQIEVINLNDSIYNEPPRQKGYHSPQNTVSPYDVLFSWHFEDPENHPMHYDLFVYEKGTQPTEPNFDGLKQNSKVMDLKPNTSYNWKVVAHDMYGAKTEGTVGSFFTCEIITPCPDQPVVYDRDGKTYGTVQICGKCWTTENMNTLSMDLISESRRNKCCENDDTLKCEENGGYYDLYRTVAHSPNNRNVQAVCPDGFHVPSELEWGSILRSASVTSLLEGGKTGLNLKATGVMTWNGVAEKGKYASFWASPFSSINKVLQINVVDSTFTFINHQHDRDGADNMYPIRCVSD